MAKKKRSKQPQARKRQAQEGPQLSAEEQAARREQQKRDWASQKARQADPDSNAPLIWGGVIVGGLVGVLVLVFVVFGGGGGGDGGSTEGPSATAAVDPRIGNAVPAQTVTVEANDQGQEVNPTFSVTTITGKVGDVIEIIVKNIGTVHHNLVVAGLDGDYGSTDDWVSNPQSIAPGETGKVLVKINQAGTYPFHCDFHPNQQKGVLILS